MKQERDRKIRYQNTKIQCNAMLHGAELSKYCRLNGEEMRLMGQAYDVLNLTARSYHRILKVARTIADLDYSEEIKLEHLQEAIGIGHWTGNIGGGMYDV